LTKSFLTVPKTVVLKFTLQFYAKEILLIMECEDELQTIDDFVFLHIIYISMITFSQFESNIAFGF
jgi:hypothetical protein